jgi:hypothetical protein
VLAACGKKAPIRLQTQSDPNAPFVDKVVVKAHAEVNVHAGARNPSGSQPVSVTLASSTSMTIDNSKFTVPAISNAVLSFGSLLVNTLHDNNLNVCGTDGKTKCGTALLRAYTSGVAGAGLWNATDGYGAPITASLTNPLTVGLGAAGAAIMQTFAIPASKHVIQLKDFTATPSYAISVDFTLAGAGSYSTTLVIEYGLTQ